MHSVGSTILQYYAVVSCLRVGLLTSWFAHLAESIARVVSYSRSAYNLPSCSREVRPWSCEVISLHEQGLVYSKMSPYVPHHGLSPESAGIRRPEWRSSTTSMRAPRGVHSAVMRGGDDNECDMCSVFPVSQEPVLPQSVNTTHRYHECHPAICRTRSGQHCPAFE